MLISCDVSTLVAAPPPTPLSPAALGTVVVQTAQAAASQTAALLPPTLTPTLTPPPSKTPTQSPTPSPTFIFILSTVSRTPTEVPASSSGGGDFGCKLLDQSPADEATLARNSVFTASWKLQNTGGSTWNSNAVDFIYLSGTRMASVRIADLPKSVASGDSVTLKLSMTAPSDSGKYKTVWTLHQGKTDFCKVSLTIVVP